MRISEHPILSFDRGKKITFLFNGKKISAYENETVASALTAAGINVLSRSIKYNRPRGFFCGIGKCSSCLMTVDGVPNVKTCVTPVKDGMVVESQDGKGNLPENKEFKSKKETLHADVAVVGAGPAGLSAAITASKHGADVLLIDENPVAGGQLIKQTHKFFGSKEHKAGVRGIEIAKLLLNEIENSNVNLLLNAGVIGYYKDNSHMLAVVQNSKLIKVYPKKIIVATGASENMLAFPGNDLPGVVGAGGVQTLMNVYGIRPGNSVLMVGAGNVGLIVSYQLMQAGINVKMVVEALPKIGGYIVHAAKLRRLGVPILTSHTVKNAYGNGRVEGARIVKLENWKETGEGFDVDVDLICLAVGLTPTCEILFQAGCETKYIPELGGWVARHDRNLETSIKGIYVAGDCSGIEEASTAMMEGRIAGMDAAEKLGFKIDEKEKKDAFENLKTLRSGPFGEKPRIGKEKMWGRK
ncbi:MAG: FAD-dependent oxidoreductase [Thermoplasmatales archaeon]|nr:FAD-dependent oxidoreductase [Thermoplasmatales archaeon]